MSNERTAITLRRHTAKKKYIDVLRACSYHAELTGGSASNILATMARDSALYRQWQEAMKKK